MMGSVDGTVYYRRTYERPVVEGFLQSTIPDGVQGVRGSNPLVPTNEINKLHHFLYIQTALYIIAGDNIRVESPNVRRSVTKQKDRPMASITIIGGESSDNGLAGVHIEGYSDVRIVDFTAKNNGGAGIAIYQHAGIMRAMGLPDATDAKALAQLLQELQSVSVAERPARVIASRLLATLVAMGANIAAVTASIVAVSDSPTVKAIIQTLLS